MNQDIIYHLPMFNFRKQYCSTEFLHPQIIKKSIRANNKIKYYKNIKKGLGSAIGLGINKSTKKGDSILIKGSRSWQLEKIIELIN